MKLLNKLIFGTTLFFVSAVFQHATLTRMKLLAVDSNNSYFYFPSTELTSSERANTKQ